MNIANVKDRLRYNKVEFILLSYLILSPFADLLTGIFIYKLGMPESFLGSPSQFIRVIFILFSLPLLDRKRLKIVFGIFCYLWTIETVSFIYIQELRSFFSGMNYFMKLLYLYLFYEIIRMINDRGEETVLKIVNVFLDSSCLYALGIIIPTVLGIGVSSYGFEDTFGQKGLFASGNALNIYLGTALSIALLRINKTKKDVIKIFILMAGIILLGTKTAFLFLFFGIMLYLKNQPKHLRMFILIFVFVIFYTYGDVILKALSGIYDVILYRFSIRVDFLTFITSGRNVYITDAFDEFFKSSIWPIKFIFGGGAFLSFRSAYYPGMSYDTLEMDMFDIFFMYGLIGAVIYMILFYVILAVSFKKSKVLFMLFALFLFHSFLAGHVVFDGLPIIAGLVLYLMMLRNLFIKKYFYI